MRARARPNLAVGQLLEVHSEAIYLRQRLVIATEIEGDR
jgi:hypothetical protein